MRSLLACNKNNSGDLIQETFQHGKFSEYEEFSSYLSESISCVYFIDDKNGFATTANGNILKTTDGGLTWETEDNIEFNYLSSFFNKNTGYTVTHSKIFKITIK